MMERFAEIWPHLIAVLSLVLAAITSAHVVLYKRDVRAAIGWAGLAWLSPMVGSALYWLFGVNRLRRRAVKLRRARGATITDSGVAERWAERLDQGEENLVRLSRMSGKVTGVPLTGGNRVEVLDGGDRAYPEMIAAIDSAHVSVAVCSYIFDYDQAGKPFIEALARAEKRGVEVRVLIDGVGARYSRPRSTRMLRQEGLRVAEFLSSRIPIRNPYYNLRNHRKITVVDGRIGFAGGLNIREGCMLSLDTDHPVQDVHFRIEGPVVAQLMVAAAEDWLFTTGELLEGEAWFPSLEPVGEVAARVIPDGPDDDFETIRWTILAALTQARESVKIVTPYFLPDQTLITALNLAALRGVDVEIVLPEKGNLRFVEWAMRGQLWQVLERCRVWFTPPPFDHSKIMLVDDAWAMVGSANWDPRSLRLNFEANLECYDPTLVATLGRLVEAKQAAGRRVFPDELNRRSVPIRLRDGVARLFSPYL